MTKALFAILLFTATAFAADVTGKWTGTIIIAHDNETRSMPAYLVFKQDGTKLTGSAGGDLEKMSVIESGSVEGNKVKFSITTEEGEKIAVDLTVDGDHISGEANSGNADGPRHAKIEAKRSE